MADTQRYWNGEHWTEDVAPAAPEPAPDVNYGKAFLVILVGILVAAALIWFVYSLGQSNKYADCLTESLDNATAGRETRDCDRYR